MERPRKQYHVLKWSTNFYLVLISHFAASFASTRRNSNPPFLFQRVLIWFFSTCRDCQRIHSFSPSSAHYHLLAWGKKLKTASNFCCEFEPMQQNLALNSVMKCERGFFFTNSLFFLVSYVSPVLDGFEWIVAAKDPSVRENLI